jgi:hypothetical protein
MRKKTCETKGSHACVYEKMCLRLASQTFRHADYEGEIQGVGEGEKASNLFVRAIAST